jgi:pantoate kinase
MREAKAFSPCHITGFFQICDKHANPLHVGSRGAGVSMKRGVETAVKVTEAQSDSTEIKINGVRQEFAEVSRYVMSYMISGLKQATHFEIDVEHNVDAPVGAGFGTSGAAALSLALALNHALGLGMSNVGAAQVAHVAEVYCRTGLGTVIAEAFGGLELRVKPGGPGIGRIKQLRVPRNTVVACLVFGPLSTKESLMNPETRKRINGCGGDLVDKLAKEPETADFLGSSRQFAENVGLISNRVRQVLDAADAAGFVCSMPMFGDSAFTLVEPELLEDLTAIFKRFPEGNVVTSLIDFEGARMLT